MPVRNQMERAVRGVLDEVLQEFPDVCKCEQCRDDIVAWALTRLPPRYAGSRSGEVVVAAELQTIPFQVEVYKVVRQAVTRISKRPHHHRT